MADYLVDIVDEQDTVVGHEFKRKVHETGLLHRIVHVFVFNQSGDVFLQTRARKEGLGTGKLDASVGGHVEKGESYRHAAIREMKEELGIDVPILFAVRFFQKEHGYSHYCTCYTARNEGPFKTDPTETVHGRFYSKADILALLVNSPEKFTTSTEQSLRHLFNVESR